MTNPTAFLSEDTFDPADAFDDYPEDHADWYCNHDVPDGCADCAWIRREEAMLSAMTPDERDEYWNACDYRDGEPF